MTTMLERAANEVAMIPMWRGSDGLNVTVSHELATHIVRAVLMAVRDLDRDIVTEAKKATVDTSGNMADFLGAPDWQVSGSFARSIDAILSETP